MLLIEKFNLLFKRSSQSILVHFSSNVSPKDVFINVFNVSKFFFGSRKFKAVSDQVDHIEYNSDILNPIVLILEAIAIQVQVLAIHSFFYFQELKIHIPCKHNKQSQVIFFPNNILPF
jgi:hypothetical protein